MGGVNAASMSRMVMFGSPRYGLRQFATSTLRFVRIQKIWNLSASFA